MSSLVALADIQESNRKPRHMHVVWFLFCIAFFGSVPLRVKSRITYIQECDGNTIRVGPVVFKRCNE